ncbi:hypothetical protein EVAR_86476_1 [Eumeta japonica]|uniref:Endonuclease/exonuclease/phosphatase domain-containing protein n=1 Tax=Eumeta variegata TaxID=151549 RepID=A0A4C1VP64_EUMVA|nr:hypothetical protein EVAR_86476_1 [Eumeta japonica]
MYYKRSLYCCPPEIPPLIDMETTSCRLAMTGHGTLVIVSIYLPGTKQLLLSDLEALLVLGDAVILFGDFNCKNPRWGCIVSNYSGNELERLEDEQDFVIIAAPTSIHFPDDLSNRLSMLDIA